MAGDWIKMRVDLRDDPEVFRLSSMLKIDRYSVVGRLHAFWSWWDEKSRNGRVDGAVTVAADEVAGMQGFGDAMLVVGWLGQDDKGLYIPNFERHNGRAAKERAQGKQRQEAYRSRNGISNAPVTRASRRSNGLSVTREDKSSSNKHTPVANSKPRSSAPANPVSETPKSTPIASSDPVSTPGVGLTDATLEKLPPNIAKAVRHGRSTSFEDTP